MRTDGTPRVRLGAALYLGFVATLAAVAGCPAEKSQPVSAPAAPPPVAAPAPTPASPPAAPPSETPSPAPAPSPAATAPAEGSGRIVGRVLLVRKVAPPVPVKVEGDAETCGKEHDPASLRAAADGGLADAVVYLKGLKAPPSWKPAREVTIDQKGCRYTPRVSVVPKGATATFTNSDPIAHDINATSALNKVPAVTIPAQGKLEYVFKETEPGILLGCKRHPFMGGVVFVAEHPWYAVTDATGAFALEGVPSGTHTIFGWHEDKALRKTSKEGTKVTVRAGETTRMDLKYD